MIKDLQDKVAVVTGGASGIGFALAKRALAEGMLVVIADIEQVALDRAAAELGAGPRLMSVVTDVSSAAAVEELARQTLDSFGPACFLFNNAGVGGGGALWEQSEAEWQWVLAVNLGGVINGVRAFTPQMLDRQEGHIINTASIAGLVSAQGTSTYTVSKHAVVALSEVLYGDLRNTGANIGVSVLCPSFVNTQIYDYERNRPGAREAHEGSEPTPQARAVEEAQAAFFSSALCPDVVAEQVFNAIANEQFYILTHPEGSKKQVEERMRGILANNGPAIIGAGEFPQV